PLDTRDWLLSKGMTAKCAYANAVLQQSFLLYNFHPKYDWPADVPHATLRSSEGGESRGSDTTRMAR
ncbi:MAG: hypothetical protein K6T83_15530, partial [Alicyclobacillus sp.]|nr:hypothetical protein [Alicyclobacillus sp.]